MFGNRFVCYVKQMSDFTDSFAVEWTALCCRREARFYHVGDIFESAIGETFKHVYFYCCIMA